MFASYHPGSLTPDRYDAWSRTRVPGPTAGPAARAGPATGTTASQPPASGRSRADTERHKRMRSLLGGRNRPHGGCRPGQRSVGAALLLAACAKSENGGTPSGGGSAGQQQVASPSTGSGGCTLQSYGGPKLDLKDAVVGFSQSEKEANPFRIAETQSIKDEAAKLGVKKLLTTNAQSQLSKQISDIQDMLAQGAQFLIVAPLNSAGLEPALQAAAAKKVPVLTIDRKINATACKDYVAFLGSNFVEQGKRAADALVKATGGKGKVAILLGSSGNNVTTDRTNGFVDQLKSTAPRLEVVAQQTGEFARVKGQQVIGTLMENKPDSTAGKAGNELLSLLS